MFSRGSGSTRVGLGLSCVVSVGLMSGVVSAQELLYSQPVTTGGGVTWDSSYWVDPGGENDLDTDAQAWANFTLDHRALVTRLRWWGESMPPLGFTVSFYNQDPNTVAIQPDIFGANPTGAILEEDFPAPMGAPGGFFVDLQTPIVFEANTRYFVSVIGLTPVPFAGWGWAASDTHNGGTFYWVRGQHTYSHLPDDRAFELLGDCLDCVAPCIADLNSDGSLDFFDVSAFLSAFSAGDLSADFSGDGQLNFFDVSAFLSAYTAGCP